MTQALLLIDIQNEYFPGGKMELVGVHEAAANARKLLDSFRAKRLPIFHVRHVMPGDDAPAYQAGTSGVEIHGSVAPLDGEPVTTKHQINAFRETDLLDLVRSKDVTDLVIVGAMSHMCIDAAARAAVDYGFLVTVAHDACATKDLEFAGETIPAKPVHQAYMAALGWGYCAVKSTAEVLGG